MANTSKKTKGNSEQDQQVIGQIPNYNISLKSLHDCRRLVNWVANMIRQRKIKVDEGKALVYCAITSSALIKDMEAFPQIKELKEIAAKYELEMRDRRY